MLQALGTAAVPGDGHAQASPAVFGHREGTAHTARINAHVRDFGIAGGACLLHRLADAGNRHLAARVFGFVPREHALHLVDDGETTWITVEPGGAPSLVAWLNSMRFMLRVEVADVTAHWAVLGEPIGAESAPGEPLAWVDAWPALVGDTAAYGPVEGHPGEGRAWRELIVARPDLEAAVGDRPLAGTWAAEALRVMAWRPRLGAETDHRTIAHEVDWLRTAVHLHKGCYRGQETIARVHNLGRPPRRLVFLHLDGSGHVLPDAGAPVRFGDREVGRITTVARHHEDGPIALAVIKRSIPEDVDLLVGETAACQTVVVSG